MNSSSIFQSIGVSFNYDNNLRDDSYFSKRRYSLLGNSYLENNNFLPLKIINCKTDYSKDIFNLSIQNDFERKSITESTVIRPKIFTCQVLLTNFYDFFVGINKFFLTNEVKNYITIFEMLHYESYMCTIYINSQILENMCLTAFSPVENYRNQGDYMTLNLTFKEILVFEVDKKNTINNANLSEENINSRIKNLF